MRLRSFIRDFYRIILLLFNAGKSIFLINITILICQSILPVTTLYFIKEFFDLIIKGGDVLPDIIINLILLGLSQWILSILNHYHAIVNLHAQYKLSDHLSEQVLFRASNVPYGYYENPFYHDTLHLAQYQAFYRASQISLYFNALILNSFSLLFLIIYLFTIQMQYALAFVLLCLPLAIVKWLLGVTLAHLEGRVATEEREAVYLQKILTDIHFAKESRLFGFSLRYINKFRELKSFIHQEKLSTQKKFLIYLIIAECLEITAMVVLFIIFAQQTLLGTIAIGILVIYVQGFQRLQQTIRGFLQASIQLFQQRHFLKDLFRFIDIPIVSKYERKEIFPLSPEELNIKELSFTYPGSDEKTLSDISISCKVGEIIAIVGENGSGKSTLVKLLARLYDADDCKIQINDTSIHAINDEGFNKETFFLFQDFQRYDFSVKENIIMADSSNSLNNEAIDNQILKAMQMSGADTLLKAMPFSVNTRLGSVFQGSKQLSGGEWQKLVLSRLFYKSEAKLVVLDEPTSALDPLSEAQVFKRIKETAANRITFLVTHRIHNLKIADKIFVIAKGRIAEQGSYEQLISEKGLFYSMYQKQLI